MHLRTYYPTVVLSDIHLGTSHSKTIEVSNFLKSVNCDRLILNGDIIDGWHLRKAGTKRWQAKHTDFFKVIMKMMENFGTEVIYVRGNHDDFLDSLVPMTFYNVKIVKEYILETVSYTHLANPLSMRFVMLSSSKLALVMVQNKASTMKLSTSFSTGRECWRN